MSWNRKGCIQKGRIRGGDGEGCEEVAECSALKEGRAASSLLSQLDMVLLNPSGES